jgi:hypothetical protein
MSQTGCVLWGTMVAPTARPFVHGLRGGNGESASASLPEMIRINLEQRNIIRIVESHPLDDYRCVPVFWRMDQATVPVPCPCSTGIHNVA